MNGVLYVASGERYYNEAMQAIRRTKEVMPTTPIALCTDWEDGKNNSDVEYHMPLKNPTYTFKDKVNNYYNSPFDKTIFLDTDTYLIDSIDILFDMCLMMGYNQ